MSQINAHFSFHPVGQGLFYTGDVGGFNFVYDCGAKFKQKFLLQAIHGYQRQVSGLDMVILSHLHEDHICGLKELVKTLRPRRILIPYISPEEMLLSFVYAKGNPDIIEALKYFAGRMYGVVASPNTFLGETRITVIKHVEAHTESTSVSVSALGDIIGDDMVVQTDTKEYEFKFFNSDSFDNRTIARFYAEIEKTYKKDWRQRLVDIVISDLPGIEKIYRDCFGKKKINLTTLVCCHGPTGEAHSFSVEQWGKQTWGMFSDMPSLPARQLLTGDIDFNSSLMEMRQHYAREWPGIVLALVPHHGARTSWASWTFYALPGVEYWPCTFGIGNKYHHPHFETVNSFLAGGQIFIPCTESQGSEIRINLTM